MPPLVFEFAWSEERIEHIARHGVTPEEVDKAVIRNARCHVVRLGPSHRNPGQMRYRWYGRTAEGRYLFGIMIYLGHGLVLLR